MKTRRLAVFAVFAALIGIPYAGAATPAATTLSVDLRDIARFEGEAQPAAGAILEAMEKDPKAYFPEGVTLSPYGPGRSNQIIVGPSGKKSTLPKHTINSVYGVEFEAPTTVEEASGRVHASVLAFFNEKKTGFAYRRFDLTLEGSPLSVTGVALKEEFSSKDTVFSGEVSLIQRKVIFTDSRHGIKKIYPIAPGGFDEGLTRESGGKKQILTPLYANATLMRSRAIADLWDPAYYAGMPYLPIVNSAKVTQPIAFHIVQHPAEAPGGLDYNYMIRGFDSHGCMRLREKDLYELFSILMSQGAPTIAINVHYLVADTADHPYPLRNDGYTTIANFGSPKQPLIHHDPHGLVIMKDVKGEPPIAAVLPKVQAPDEVSGAPMESLGAEPVASQAELDALFREIGLR